MDQKPRLTRSLTDRIFAGICGGLAAYTGLNALWLRLIFLAAMLATKGFGALAYVLLWMALPPETLDDLPPLTPGEAAVQAPAGPSQRAVLGLGITAVGLVFLVLPIEALWPAAMLGLGGALLWRQFQGV